MIDQNFIIVGAGIAGLCLAKAFEDLNISYTLYEKADEVRGIGAGFGLASNAMKAFEILGYDDKIIPLGHMLDDFEIQDWKEKTILKADTNRLRKNYNTDNFAIHRADLHHYLYQSINPKNVVTGKKVVDLQQSYDKVVLYFDDDTNETTDFVIASDGISSAIRQKLLPKSTPKYAGYICWRGVIKDENYTSKKSIETWGPNGRFGLTPLKDNQIYWYACKNTPLNSDVYQWDLTDIRRNFADYSGLIRSTLQKTNQQDLITAPIMDLEPINSYNFNRVLIIGDAAHATTPNMGQGACMAVEDVCVLVDELKNNPDNIILCFENYNKRRLKRTQYIIHTSRLAGKVAQLENKILTSVRNFAFRQLPTSIAQSPLDDLLEQDFMTL
ncbi:FAD-dependent monooxygenase [Faecalibacter macacae]|uniref:Monooxygenase n=1 Tax=Faecalibacter macacae TaxID=1859289 RepID=A0A3L9MAP2_9FLAO|nr:FAD-dependent monooxygenase [Faecalibacter macacae]RLZ09891.1 monooxygenase [Faecalibacter macacae]